MNPIYTALDNALTDSTHFINDRLDALNKDEYTREFDYSLTEAGLIVNASYSVDRHTQNYYDSHSMIISNVIVPDRITKKAALEAARDANAYWNSETGSNLARETMPEDAESFIAAIADALDLDYLALSPFITFEGSYDATEEFDADDFLKAWDA